LDAVTSTTLWLVPVKVAAQLKDVGEVRVNVPAVMVRVPVIVQLDPAGTAPPHAAASALPDVTTAVPATSTPVDSTAAAKPAPARRLDARLGSTTLFA
jgi:hypothetical protein